MIAIITNYWINSNGGGIREYTKNLVRELEELDTNVIVLFREGEDKNNYKLSSNVVKFIFEAMKILKKEKPDVILSQGGWFTEIPAWLYKRKNPRSKIFVLFHTQPTGKWRFTKRMAYNIIINKFDKVGFVSKALEKNVREIAGLKIKKDTFILYAGARSKEVNPEDIERFRREYNIPSDSFLLLGQALTAYELKAEGVKILINAVKILRDKGYDVVLILTREGRYSGMLKEFAKNMNMDKHVIFTGDVDDPYVPLAICDIYTHITLGEGGLSVSLLEAMAMGKPIIATCVGGIPEAIENGKNGILVDADAESVAEAIERLIKNENMREKLGKEAEKTAREKFTWDRTAKEFLKIMGVDGI